MDVISLLAREDAVFSAVCGPPLHAQHPKFHPTVAHTYPHLHLRRLVPPQDDPLLQDLYGSYSHDSARMEALASESSKKRTREAQQKGKT